MAEATHTPAVFETVEVEPASITLTLTEDEAYRLVTVLGRVSALSHFSTSPVFSALWNAGIRPRPCEVAMAAFDLIRIDRAGFVEPLADWERDLLNYPPDREEPPW